MKASNPDFQTNYASFEDGEDGDGSPIFELEQEEEIDYGWGGVAGVAGGAGTNGIEG